MIKRKYLILILSLIAAGIMVGAVCWVGFSSPKIEALEVHYELKLVEAFKEVTDLSADNSQLVNDLRKEYGNEDIIGYIQLNGTQIAYPLLQGKDNEKYLNANPSGNSDINGSIYLDMDNASNLMDRSSLIYGHDMLDGSMFGSLDNLYSTQESFDMTGKTFTIYLEKGTLIYDIAAYGIINENDRGYVLGEESGWRIENYVNEALGNSSIQNEEELTINEETRAVNLITCFGNEAQSRVRVLGVLKI